ncbi:MAG: winged helix-turn-helix domain-containing protein [Pyrinomonadaceae bacterium]
MDSVHLMLYRGEKEISLTPKQVETLLALVEKGGEIVSKDDLMSRLWGDTAVEEANLIQNIHALRKFLGDAPDGRPMIETLRRRGYRFTADLKTPKDGLEKTPNLNVPAADPQPWFVQRPIAISLAIIGLLGLVIIGSSFLFGRRSAPVAGRMHFAVLPMRPIDSANRNELYEVGIADLLIHRLNSISGFIVRPLSATRNYSALDQDALAAGREQKVDCVLASNYLIADGKLRITAQLINVATGATEGTYQVETDTGNIFASQNAVADDIVKQLVSRFEKTEVTTAGRRGTSNEEAYRLYVQGRNLTMKRNRNDNLKAIEYFEQAIALDPNFALAYARMAGAVLDTGGDDRSASAEKVDQLIEKALELDPNSAEAYVTRGTVNLLREWNIKAAENDLLHAIELEPNSDAAHWTLAMALSDRGRFDEALREIETAQSIDPGAVAYMFHRGRILYYARRYEQAVAQFNQAIDLDDRFIQPFGSMVRVYETAGDYDTAFKYFLKREERSPRREQVEKYKRVYETEGWLGVRRILSESGTNDFDMARLYALRGEKDAAFESLEKAVDKKEWIIRTINVEPAFDNLRGDPRFAELVRSLAFERG